MKGYVYILVSLKDNKQYIGSTKNLIKRFWEHNQGRVKSTKFRRPFKLKCAIEFDTIEQAAEMEKKIQKKPRRIKKGVDKTKMITFGEEFDGRIRAWGA